MINIKNKNEYELYLLLFNNNNFPINRITLEFINNRFIYNNKQLGYLAEQLGFEGIILN
jgi:hypothetical protein